MSVSPHPSLSDLARCERPFVVMVEIAGERWFLSRDGTLLDDPDDSNVATYSPSEIAGPFSPARRDCARVETGAEAVGIPLVASVVSRGNARMTYEGARGE